jgi:hypothetical protein
VTARPPFTIADLTLLQNVALSIGAVGGDKIGVRDGCDE